MMPIVIYQVDLDFLTIKSKVNGLSKAKMQSDVTDINHCQYEHKKPCNLE